MATRKKYYWLKLDRNFFKRHDIQVIESMDNGKDYILFYLKLLVESIDHEGALRFSQAIPYDDKMLSIITKTNIDIVRAAIGLFSELNLMEIFDDKTIYLNETKKMLGEASSTHRVQAFRERQKTLQIEEVKHNETLQKRFDETQLELDKEKELDKELKKEVKSTRTPKHKYGEYSHVLLTEEQHSKLTTDYTNTEALIKFLDEYIEMKGYKAKNHYLAIKKWVVDAVKEREQKQPKKEYSTVSEELDARVKRARKYMEVN